MNRKYLTFSKPLREQRERGREREREREGEQVRVLNLPACVEHVGHKGHRVHASHNVHNIHDNSWKCRCLQNQRQLVSNSNPLGGCYLWTS